MRPDAVWAMLTAVLIAGCSNTVTTMGVVYNEGLADSFNSLILANVVRSAKGYPTYYSAIGDFSGVDTSSVEILPEVISTLNSLSTTELDLQPTITTERDKTVAVSSLETQDFTTSMHANVDAAIFETLIESRDSQHLNLALAILVEKIAVPEDEYNYVLASVGTICAERYELLSGPLKGLCGLSPAGGPKCLDRRAVRDSSGRLVNIILLSNDPSNSCLFTTFRTFIEALSLNDPHIDIDSDGQGVIRLTQLPESRVLFQAEDSGILLRSPHEMIAYLGVIVQETFNGRGGELVLTGPSGAPVPLFKVEQGYKSKTDQITARVNGVIYSVPDSGFGPNDAHFTPRALALVKDIITLNTAQTQLSTQRAVFIGGLLPN